MAGTSVRVRFGNPAILTWARESAGYTVEQLAEYMDQQPATIQQWESGASAPTYRQLQKMANKFKRPLAAFFLPEVPPAEEMPRDFRTLPGHRDAPLTPESRIAYRSVRTQLAEVRELLASLGRNTTLAVPRWGIDDDPEAMAAELRRTLGRPGTADGAPVSPSVAMEHWRNALFDLGVVVRVCRMPVDDVRGFCLVAYDLGGVGLSNEDREHVRIFSLFHEVCHLCLGSPGISGLPARGSGNCSRSVEAYCDSFAAAFLMPADSAAVCADLNRVRHLDRTMTEEVAGRYNVSKYVVARRAFDLGYVRDDHYWDSIEEWRALDRALARRKRQDNKSGGNAIATQLSYVGRRFSGLVVDALVRNAITVSEASQMLGVSAEHLPDVGYAW